MREEDIRASPAIAASAMSRIARATTRLIHRSGEEARRSRGHPGHVEHRICAKLNGPSYARTIQSASRRPRKRGPLRLPQMHPVGPEKPMKNPITAKNTVEYFLTFRRVAIRKDWGLFEPVLGKNGRPSDAHLATVRTRLSRTHSEEHKRLFKILERLGPDGRSELRRLLRSTKPRRATTRIFEELERVFFGCVCDFACLELIYHSKNERISKSLALKLPATRNLLVELLYDRLIVSIYKLLEGATSGSRKTGSLQGLIEMIRADGFVNFADLARKRLGSRPHEKKRATGIRYAARNILKARNKYIAHMDANTILDKRHKINTRIFDLRKTIEGIGNILDQYSLAVLAESHRHADISGADDAMTQLLRMTDSFSRDPEPRP